MPDSYSLTRDPVYYITVAFFAFLTTLLPALLGQPRFLPFSQALSLTIFVALALRKGHLRGALNVLALWLSVQFVLLFVLAFLFGGLVERAIPDGFVYRGTIANWFFGDEPYPGGLLTEPLRRLGEVVGILAGSLLTGGLVGNWFLVRAVNLAAFGSGALLSVLMQPGLILFAIPVWALVRIAGYAGLVLLCAEPLLTSNWSPSFYWTQRRSLLLVSVSLLLAGLLLELILPSIWSRGAP
jgi:hypothetical protein